VIVLTLSRNPPIPHQSPAGLAADRFLENLHELDWSHSGPVLVARYGAWAKVLYLRALYATPRRVHFFRQAWSSIENADALLL
jgi:hypothetical protein